MPPDDFQKQFLEITTSTRRRIQDAWSREGLCPRLLLVKLSSKKKQSHPGVINVASSSFSLLQEGTNFSSCQDTRRRRRVL